MTFSIVARTADASHFGVAISSSSPAVAARCAHARAGVGAVATQNITDPSLGPRILDLLARGGDAGAGQPAAGVLGAGQPAAVLPGAGLPGPAQVALAAALRGTPHGAYRQLLVLGRSGAPAIHSGEHALGLVATAVGADAAAAGNLLADAAVPAAMVGAFETACGPFGARLLEALRAGRERGGEAGPVHSAGLLIVRDVAWPIVDLRVDWDDADPVGALGKLWERYAPQIEDYVRRAVDPGAAPSFGVPGDL